MFIKISLAVLLLALIVSTQGRVFVRSSSSDSSESSESSKSSESSDSSESSESKALDWLNRGRTVVVYLPAPQQETVLNSIAETEDNSVARNQLPALDAANNTLNNNVAVSHLDSKKRHSQKNI
uniref:Uncharacterized protein n=1 Tax=Timema genevievae TaxID=629358 RepID=A0A7R9PRP6_TIMGE|nr:unnamed protein product [Timema genevievae]